LKTGYAYFVFITDFHYQLIWYPFHDTVA